MFVAADAGKNFAGLRVGRRAHRLVGESVLVERLKEERLVRGDEEAGRAVGLDQDGLEDHPRVLFAGGLSLPRHTDWSATRNSGGPSGRSRRVLSSGGFEGAFWPATAES